MTEVQPRRIVALGEILWDVFEDKKRLGGAPLNFAFHAAQLGHEAWIVSRVGADALGDEILLEIESMGLSCEHIQIDRERPTGKVDVSVNLFGEPKYDIVENVAWDYLQATDLQHELVRTADVVCFGTLAQRSPASRGAIDVLLHTARREPRDILIVCDLNLRQQFYTTEIIRQSLDFARVLKLDEDEFSVVKALMGRGAAPDREFALELMDSFGLLMIAVTRSSRGCTLHTPDAEAKSPGHVVDVVDTVGCGRAFTAAMVSKLLEGAHFGQVAQYANLAGAYVATQPGATPRMDPFVLQRFKMELEGKS